MRRRGQKAASATANGDQEIGLKLMAPRVGRDSGEIRGGTQKEHTSCRGAGGMVGGEES